MTKQNDKINVTKSFLPSKEVYLHYLDKIWESGQLTNQGSLLKELEAKLESFLEVENLHFVSNGTIALQIALRALEITEGEIITTPFSYVATTSTILWERCKPVFVDIEPDTFCIDASKIEAAITKDTKAIMAVHVFGYPCDVELIEQIAQKHKIKVIYDAAHAFGVTYKGKSLLSYGDIATCSFHSTKLFHTIEGGCVIASDNIVSDKLELIKRFGHHGDEHQMLGINAKASEFQAAMGLSNLPHIRQIIEARKAIVEKYNRTLGDEFLHPLPKDDITYNYAYYPILFDDEAQLLRIIKRLQSINVFPRRYFYPSLNTLPYLKIHQSCPVSEDITKRILCLPLYPGLTTEDVNKICKAIMA